MSVSTRLNCAGGSGGRPPAADRPGKVDCGTSTSEDNMMYGGGQTTQAPAPPMEVATSGSEGEPATTPLSPLSYSQRQQLEDLNEQVQPGFMLKSHSWVLQISPSSGYRSTYIHCIYK